MQTVGEAGPRRMAESVRTVSPGLSSLVVTRHRPDLVFSPTEKGNWEERLGLSTPWLSLTSSILSLSTTNSWYLFSTAAAESLSQSAGESWGSTCQTEKGKESWSAIRNSTDGGEPLLRSPEHRAVMMCL